MTDQEKLSLEELVLNQDFQNLLKRTARRYAYKYSKFSGSSSLEVDDLISEGFIAANTAYNSYDPKFGATFVTYAYPYIRHAMDSYCRRYCHVLTISEKESRDYLGDLINRSVLRIDQDDSSDGNEFDIPASSGLEVEFDVDDYFFAGFSSFEKELARSNMIEGKTINELAVKYNISRSRIGVIIKELKDRMKEKAEEYAKEN